MKQVVKNGVIIAVHTDHEPTEDGYPGATVSYYPNSYFYDPPKVDGEGAPYIHPQPGDPEILDVVDESVDDDDIINEVVKSRGGLAAVVKSIARALNDGTFPVGTNMPNAQLIQVIKDHMP